jgi:hypothetical protein
MPNVALFAKSIVFFSFQLLRVFFAPTSGTLCVNVTLFHANCHAPRANRLIFFVPTVVPFASTVVFSLVPTSVTLRASRCDFSQLLVKGWG